MSKTRDAIKLVEKGVSVREACRTVDVSEAAVRRAMKADAAAAAGICPHCGGHVGADGKAVKAGKKK